METASSDQENTKLTEEMISLLRSIIYSLEDQLYALPRIPEFTVLRSSLGETIGIAWDTLDENS